MRIRSHMDVWGQRRTACIFGVGPSTGSPTNNAKFIVLCYYEFLINMHQYYHWNIEQFQKQASPFEYKEAPQ